MNENTLTGINSAKLHLLEVLSNGTFQNILSLIGNGTVNGAIQNLTGSGSVVISGTGNTRDIEVNLSGYQPLLTAGNNVTITGNVISASGGSGSGNSLEKFAILTGNFESQFSTRRSIIYPIVVLINYVEDDLNFK